MQMWIRGCAAVFATIKIPAPFRKTTSGLVRTLLILSETLRPGLEQAHMELYALFRTEGQKNVPCLAATLVHIINVIIRPG